METLSEQQIASCTSNPQDCGGTGGCDGGTAEVAYASLIAIGGIASEWNYPYVSYQGEDFACRVPNKTITWAANLTSYVSLPSNQVGEYFLR
jgi:cathepsin L